MEDDRARGTPRAARGQVAIGLQASPFSIYVEILVNASCDEGKASLGKPVSSCLAAPCCDADVSQGEKQTPSQVRFGSKADGGPGLAGTAAIAILHLKAAGLLPARSRRSATRRRP